MNNKGFTLIELIVTIILLAVILSIGAYSIISIVKDSKEKNYQTLIKSVKSAVESYVIECQYNGDGGGVVDCSDNEVTLGELVTYGYLSGNAKVASGDNKDNYTIVNPKDNNAINNCTVSYTRNSSGVITITTPYDSNSSYSGSCPTNIK